MKQRYNNKESVKGSLTVEAALVMPLFIFAVVIFLYCIQAVTLYEQVQAGITEVARTASKYGYIYQRVMEEKDQETDQETESEEVNTNSEASKIVGSLIDGSFFKIKFLSIMKEYSVNDKLIHNGLEGVLFLGSHFMNEDKIKVIASYQLEIPMLFFKVRPIYIQQGVMSRGFVGYSLVHVDDRSDKEIESENVYVYKTKNGIVYHLNEKCTYLYRQPVPYTIEQIAKKRNRSGAKYYPCETCIKRSSSLNIQYYITKNGTRYHSSSSCTQLERDSIKVLLSEVDHLRACSKCGGK